MASKFAVSALCFSFARCSGHVFDAEDSVFPDPSLSLLQHKVQKTHKYRPGNPYISAGEPGGVEPLAATVVTQRWQWAEFKHGGVLHFNVPKTPVKIVGWTGMGMFMNPDILEKLYPQCTYSELPHGEKDRSVWMGKTTDPMEYVISDPDTDTSDADVVLFYLPFFMRTNVLPSTKPRGQLWIATCGESLERPETRMDCHQALDRKFMRHFDGFASYHGSADFLDAHVELFTSYQDPPDAPMLKSALPRGTDFGASGDDLISLSLSDCASGERNAWITSFVDHFERRGRSSSLVSYGRCFHNREEPEKDCEDNRMWYDHWSNRCSARPFKIVAENRLEPWYVTEKVWDALWEGSIPVYFGTPEVKYLVPPGSILYYADFESPEALADHILRFDEEKFAAARSWRSLPESEWGNFSTTRRYGHNTLLPRLCAAGAKAKQALAAGGEAAAEDEAVASPAEEQRRRIWESAPVGGEAAEDEAGAPQAAEEEILLAQNGEVAAAAAETASELTSTEIFAAGFRAGYEEATRS